MPKFRKKPVEVEAVQWFPGVEHPGVHHDMGYASIGGRGHGMQTFKQDDRPHVITVHEQKAFLEPGDWILPEPKDGRFYPCKPDIFAATYDVIE
jgi:hypothetical protein